jgi:poly(hydroxyalkanoate) depolymerase family esterase
MRRRIVLISLAGVGAVLAAVVGVSAMGPSANPGTSHLRHARLEVGGDIYPFAVYAPAGDRVASALPLVVVVHGCGLTADQQAAASGWDAIAQRARLAVMYPDVSPVDEAQGRCWKGIWDPGAEARGRGDAGAIADMTRAVIARWHIDRFRVYAIGISAGGYEASLLGANYPDLYAAIGIHSGAAYMTAQQQRCLAGNASPTDTAALARAALRAMGRRARVMPVVAFHGDADPTVPFRCGQQAIAQWLLTDDLVLRHEHRAPLGSTPIMSHGLVPNGHAYTVTTYPDRNGCPVAQLWTIHGMGHYWSGGSADRAWLRYSDPQGPSAAAGAWAFFSRWRLDANPTCASTHRPICC